MSPSLANQQFQWMRDAQRDLYKTAIASLAEGSKLRPVYVTKKPVTEQITWLHKQLKAKKTNMLGEHLLQAWFMKGQQEMLISFCDSMEIKHDGTGAVEEELPKDLNAEKLKFAVDTLFEKFPADITSLYLYVFNIQNNDGWKNLTKMLAEDSRITLA